MILIKGGVAEKNGITFSPNTDTLGLSSRKVKSLLQLLNSPDHELDHSPEEHWTTVISKPRSGRKELRELE